MVAVRLWWRLAQRQESQRLTVGLSLVAFASATGVLLTVLGGLGAFSARNGSGDYVLLAQVATVILVVPVVTLGGSAARLAVSRRDQRLAALRLAGATSGQVGALAVLDAAAQALVGALLGVVLYLGALPGVALLHFQGRAFAWGELWVGLPQLLLVLAGVVTLAVLSAILGLTRIVLSPLGVARRVAPRRLSVVRVLLAVPLLLLWSPMTRHVDLTNLVPVLVVFGLCFGVLNLVGPFVLNLVGKLRVRRAAGVASLLAARRLLDDPKGAWRTVSGVSLATFVAGILSVSPAIADSTEGDPGAHFLAVDLMTGAVLTLVIAALLAAVSSGVTSAARLLDQRQQYHHLHLAGADLATLKRIRLSETLLPLAISMTVAATVAMVLVAPIGLTLITSTASGLGMFGGGVAVAVALVVAAVALSQPLVDTVAVVG